jgi:hypothetical protein
MCLIFRTPPYQEQINVTDPGLPKQTEAEQILISGAKKVPQFTMAKKLMQLPDCSALQYSMWQFMLKGSALYPPLASNPGLQRLARCLDFDGSDGLGNSDGPVLANPETEQSHTLITSSNPNRIADCIGKVLLWNKYWSTNKLISWIEGYLTYKGRQLVLKAACSEGSLF